MAKVNKKHGQPTQRPGQQGKNAVKRRQHSQVLPQKQKQKQSAKTKAATGEPVQANQRPKVPFSKKDRVLLIGEGDFSFALSLVKHHRIQSLTATCYDSEAELIQKYPRVKSTIGQLLALGLHSPAESEHSQAEESSFEGFSPPAQHPPSAATEDHANINENKLNDTNPQPHRPEIHILYSIDATRLSNTHAKALRPHQPFTKIVFNFPHTGGLSTDVNRQVRANQQLLVSFFNSAKPLLEHTLNHQHRSQLHPQSRSDRYSTPSSSSSSSSDSDTSPSLTPSHPNPQPYHHPHILTTLFTTPPYTLWNIRDLARHAGLSVTTSFQFPWAAYPGYTHARTLGDITGGKGRGGEEREDGHGGGKRRGAWRGEEREARTYVLELKMGEGIGGGGGGKGRMDAEGQRKRKWSGGGGNGANREEHSDSD